MGPCLHFFSMDLWSSAEEPGLCFRIERGISERWIYSTVPWVWEGSMDFMDFWYARFEDESCV